MSNKTALRFICPNCFQVSEKGVATLMLAGNIALAGSDVEWSGDLEKDIHRVKRLTSCPRCRAPIDNHALLRGHLDERKFPGIGSTLAFLVSLAAFAWFRLPWWATGGLAFLTMIVVGWSLLLLERRQISRWRLSEESALKLKSIG